MDFKPLQRNLQVYTVKPPRATSFRTRPPSQITENGLSQSLILEPLVKDNYNNNNNNNNNYNNNNNNDFSIYIAQNTLVYDLMRFTSQCL